jgi:asparagine synthase (glutamine-hydrolysing)
LAERSEKLLAYTAVPREGFAGPAPKGYHVDEETGARALAARFDNIEHILIRPEGSLPIEFLRQEIEALGHPSLSSLDMAWTRAIQADAVQRGAKVLLAGAAGNVTISYKGDLYLPVLLGRGQWLTLWREIQALKRQNPDLRRRHWLRRALAPYLRAARPMTAPKQPKQGLQPTGYSPIHPDFVARMGTAERAARITRSISHRPWADGRVMRAEAFTLMETGGYTAAINTLGLERRDPTADRRLVDFCLSIPESQYQHEGQSRWLLHRLMGDVLPPEILTSTTKGLQAADWYETLGQSLPHIRAELIRLRAHSSANDYVDLGALLQAIEDWPTTGWERGNITKLYRQKLPWGLSVSTFIEYNFDCATSA